MTRGSVHPPLGVVLPVVVPAVVPDQGVPDQGLRLGGSSPIKAFPIKAFPIKAFRAGGIFDALKVDCVNYGTLGDVSTADGWIDGATLDALIALVAGDAGLREAFDAYGLYDLLVALIPPDSVPWEQLDLDVAGIQNAASPLVDPFQYNADITLSAPATSTTLQVVLPEGFAYVPGGSTLWRLDPERSATGQSGALGVVGDRRVRRRRWSDDPHVHAGEPARGVDSCGGHRSSRSDARCRRSRCVRRRDRGQPERPELGHDERDRRRGRRPPAPDHPPAHRHRRHHGRHGVDVNLGYVSRAGSVDLYSFQITEPDANLGVHGDLFLSNLPADYDLVLYGRRSTPLRNQPTSSVGYVDDVQVRPQPPRRSGPGRHGPGRAADAPDRARLQSRPTTSPWPSRLIRGVNDEQIQTGTLRAGTYYVQISAYNTAFSDTPYALRFRTDGSAQRVCPAGPAYPTGGQGVLPTPTSLSADVNTLFLVNEQLLRATYGPQAQTILDAADVSRTPRRSA